MKKIFLMIAATAAVMFTSCSKENETTPKAKETVLTVKVASAELGTKSDATPMGVGYKTPLADGMIFICGIGGSITTAVPINATDINGAGQVIPGVASDATVYIVGNVPAAKITAWTATKPASLAALNAELLDIKDQNGQDYTKATLANAGATATPITISADPTKATVTVQLSPVYSRLEVYKVTAKAGSTITGFTVAGIYVDQYYPSYTIGGNGSGTMYDNHQATTYTGLPEMKLEGTFAASGTPLQASAAGCWGFNVPAGSLPKIIVKLTNVTGTKGGLAIPAGTYYLTVKSYNAGGLTSFVRGNTYRIGSSTTVGANGIEFGENDITVVPWNDNVELNVKVDILAWILNDISAEL